MSFHGHIPLPEHGTFRGGIARGANLRTPCGLRGIEMVRPGDLVVTRNGLRPVRMVWTRCVTREQMQMSADLAPIRLKPRAIGPMMPQRDLLLAPDHHLLVPGHRMAGMPDGIPVLTEARRLAGTCDSVHVDMSMDSVTFYHLVFDRQQILAANGLPVASFLPDAVALRDLGGPMRDALEDRFPALRERPDSYPAPEFGFAPDAEYLPYYA